MDQVPYLCKGIINVKNVKEDRLPTYIRTKMYSQKIRFRSPGEKIRNTEIQVKELDTKSTV